MDLTTINKYEKLYFEKINSIIESNGTTFIKNILSQFELEYSSITGKKSVIQEGVERVVQSIISKHVDWDICSTGLGSDSIFMTPKAVIHIDSKAVKWDDGDADNKINLGKNQTSYFTEEPLIKEQIPFTSKLPLMYKHRLYNDLICLTYFVKFVYKLDSQNNKFEDYKIMIGCVPNGRLFRTLGEEFIDAGKTKVANIQLAIPREDYEALHKRCDTAQKQLLNNIYTEANIIYLKNFNVEDEIDDTEDEVIETIEDEIAIENDTVINQKTLNKIFNKGYPRRTSTDIKKEIKRITKNSTIF